MSSDLGRRLNRARRETGLSVGELADRLGVSRGLVSDMLAGKRSPTPPLVQKLTQVLSLDHQTRLELEEIDEVTYMSSALDGPIRLDSKSDDPERS